MMGSWKEQMEQDVIAFESELGKDENVNHYTKTQFHKLARLMRMLIMEIEEVRE